MIIERKKKGLRFLSAILNSLQPGMKGHEEKQVFPPSRKIRPAVVAARSPLNEKE